MQGHDARVALGSGDWLGIAGLIVVAVSVIGVMILIGWIADRRSPGGDAAADWDDPDLGAMEVLRIRLALGEISREEYLAAKQTLDTEA